MPKDLLSRRDKNAAATRVALLKAARHVFTRDGYQASAMEAITDRARVTRGALYHHFDGKLGLFDALVSQMQEEVAESIQAKARSETDLRRRLDVGVDVYLDECLRKDFRRLVLEEATGVLGRERLREIESRYTTRLVVANLETLGSQGHLQAGANPQFLASMLEALLCEVALQQEHAEDRAALRRDVHALIARMLD